MFETIRNFFASLSFETMIGRDIDAMLGEGRYVAYTLVFLGVVLAFEGLRHFLARGENRAEAVNRRMHMRSLGKSDEEILAILKPPKKKGLLGNLPFVGDLGVALSNAGITASPEIFFGGCVASFALVAIAGSQMTSALIATVGAGVLFLVLPFLVLGSMYKKRIAKT